MNNKKRMTRTIKQQIRIFTFLTLGLLSMPAAALNELSGNLAHYLKTIDYGKRGDNTWVKPSRQNQLDFSRAFTAFIAGDYSQAALLAEGVGYQLIKFTHSDGSRHETHYILQERSPLGSAGFIGGGTFVAFPEGLNAVLQAPHPRKDSFTENQAIESYLEVKPTLLMLAGTRRDSRTSKSPCTNGRYNSSDVAHQTQSLFYTAHTVVSDFDPETVFIQFHGFGSRSLSQLQGQCHSKNPNLVNLSEGVKYPSSEREFSLMQILRSKINAGGEIKACIYGNDTKSLGGTWNVEARYTNGSMNACLYNAPVSSKRFIHLEQSYMLRKKHRTTMSRHIQEALSEYFQLSASHQGSHTAKNSITK